MARRKKIFADLADTCIVIQAAGVDVPAGRARIRRVDFKGQGFKATDWALASLGVRAKLGLVIRPEMFEAALRARLKGEALSAALDLAGKVQIGEWQ